MKRRDEPVLGSRARAAARTNVGGVKRQKLLTLIAAYADAGEQSPSMTELSGRLREPGRHLGDCAGRGRERRSLPGSEALADQGAALARLLEHAMIGQGGVLRIKSARHPLLRLAQTRLAAAQLGPLLKEA